MFRGGEHTRYGMIGAYPRALKDSADYSVKDVKDLVLQSIHKTNGPKESKRPTKKP